MKIGDVKVGAVLALDASEKYGRDLPRKVEVLAITPVEETYWQSGFRPQRATRTVRRVEVKFLDSPTGESSRYAKYKYAEAEQGATAVVEAKKLIAPWADVAKYVDARIEKASKQAANKAEAERRLEALFGKKMDTLDFYVSTAWDDSAEVRFDGTSLDTILTLAERGKKAVE